MAKCIWAVLCRRSIIDREENTISLLEGLDEIQFTNPIPAEAYADKPALIPGSLSYVAHLASLWWKTDSEEFRIRARVLAPNRKSIYEKELDLNFQGRQRARHILRFHGFFYAGPGTYTYQVQQQKNERWITAAESYLTMTEPET